jgi:hypothetical protein
MDLDYDGNLSDDAVKRLEEAARAVGLALREVELLGQDASVAEAFVRSVREGRHHEFLDEIDWTRLQPRLHGPPPRGGPVALGDPAPA